MVGGGRPPSKSTWQRGGATPPFRPQTYPQAVQLRGVALALGLKGHSRGVHITLCTCRLVKRLEMEQRGRTCS